MYAKRIADDMCCEKKKANTQNFCHGVDSVFSRYIRFAYDRVVYRYTNTHLTTGERVKTVKLG